MCSDRHNSVPCHEFLCNFQATLGSRFSAPLQLPILQWAVVAALAGYTRHYQLWTLWWTSNMFSVSRSVNQNTVLAFRLWSPGFIPFITQTRRGNAALCTEVYAVTGHVCEGGNSWISQFTFLDWSFLVCLARTVALKYWTNLIFVGGRQCP
jgi:hypothetical protein